MCLPEGFRIPGRGMVLLQFHTSYPYSHSGIFYTRSGHWHLIIPCLRTGISANCIYAMAEVRKSMSSFPALLLAHASTFGSAGPPDPTSTMSSTYSVPLIILLCPSPAKSLFDSCGIQSVLQNLKPKWR